MTLNKVKHLFTFLLILFLSACDKGGMFNKISVLKLVDPDKTIPELSITSTPVALTGDHTYTLHYDVEDNAGGSGIKRIEIYYSPDGQEATYKYVGNGAVGLNASVDFCVPNKNHSQPTFKVIAYDKSGNKAIKYIGDVSGQNFSINTTNPVIPTLTSTRGLVTKSNSTQLAISACPQTQCSATSLKYEAFPTNTFVLFNNAAQPLASDADWISCSNVLANKYTTPNFSTEGPYTFKVWTKTNALEQDGTTALNLVSSTSNSITVTYDVTPPTNTLSNLTTVGGGLPVSVTFTQSDLNGIASNKLQYSADGTTFVDVASNVTSPYSWTPPTDNSTTAKLKLITTDNAGNTQEITNNFFNVDSIVPSAPSVTLISPAISSSTDVTVRVADCTDRDKILINESPIAPASSDGNWQSCTTAVGGITQTLTGPLVQGNHNLYVWAKDLGQNISPAATNLSFIYDTTVPTLSLTAFNALYKGGDSITLNFSATDTNGISSFKLEYSPDGTTYSLVDTLANNATSYTWTIPAANTSAARFRLTATDGATTTNTATLVSSNFTIDTTPPSVASLFVEGTVITGKSYGTYRINDCSDVTNVLVERTSTGTPAENDSRWVPCSQAAYNITTNDFLPGDNSLKFWVKDGAGNINNTYLSFNTRYNPPTFTVVNGPTISTPIADITIQFCDEAGISKVLFNETGTMPIAADTAWQSCNTAIGALKSATLSPGPHTLKAFFKYNDNVQSKNPIDVYVNYTATLTWAEPPSVNRPQTKFTLATCAGIDKVFLNKSTAPLATDPGWQNCSTAAGALTFDGLSSGVNTINAWFKDSSNNLFSNYASATATYNPPTATLNNGSTVQDPEAQLTINDCTNISQVYVGLDSATQPAASDGGWVSCSTANNAISSPTISTAGSHTLYTWFKYTDNYILPDPDIDNIVYDPYDVTPPDIAGANVGNTAITLSLTNGFGASPYLLVKDKLTYVATTYSDHVTRATFTINTCNPTGSADPKESIASVLVSTNSDIGTISSSDPYWQACSTAANAIQTQTLNDSADTQLYFYYKDAAGNIAGFDGGHATQTVHVKVDTSDVTPPPRPYVEITTPPTLTMSPAQMWVDDVNGCNDVDQVYVNIYSRKYDGLPTETLNEAAPLKTAAGWQNCKVKGGSTALTDTFNYNIILSGSYTLNVWFKDNAGNINPTPRQVSFIFNPIPSSMPNPLAYWSFDSNHFKKNKLADIKGTNHLSVFPYSATAVNKSYGKIKEGFDLSSNKYALTKNTTTLQPTVSVSMSAWVGLTQNDNGNKFIAGNKVGTGGYALTLEGGFLRFYVNGRKAEVATSTYSTGIHNVVGTSDGRYIKLYVDGSVVGSNDGGAPENINQGTSPVFAVGVNPNATTNYNTGDSRFFNGTIDDLVIWDKYLTATQVFRHYVDGMNILKVNEQHTTPSPTMGTVTFYGDFMQNAMLTMPSCTNIRFVYTNETTHPPTANSNWIPCNTLPGGIIHANLSQGYHQLKVWTKDEYDNISSTYSLVDTTITSIVYQAPPETYFTLDNQHYSNGVVRDLFSGLVGDNLNGAQSNQSGVGYKNEGFAFTASSQQSLEALYATPTQLKDKVTLSTWAHLTANDSRDQRISGNTGYYFYIDQATNRLGFAVNTSGGIRKASVATNSYITGYHNLIGSYDGRYVNLFMDGNPIASVDYTTTLEIEYTCMSSFTIGGGATCNQGALANQFFNGGADEVILWNDALTDSVVYDFFNGQDNVPPLPLTIEPKGNSFHVTIPIASFRSTDCGDVASVYVTLGNTKPTAETANWQTCSDTLYSIKSPLLDNKDDPAETTNVLHFWFKDAAGNVSDTSTDVTMYYKYDFTVPNPLAYWPFDIANSHDEVATDVFGGFDATKYNLAWATGASDEGVTFNGSTSYAEVPYNSVFSLQNKVTLSVWFKISGYTAGEKGLIGNYNNGGYGILLDNNLLKFKVKVNNANAFDEISYDLSSGPLNFSNWHHAAAVYDRGLMRLFLNSVEVATYTIPDVGPGVKPAIQYAQNNSLIIGALPSTTTGAAGGYFAGDLDEASTFNDALTDTVISEIYTRGANGDKTAYQVTPPTVPMNLNIIYYNSLVSRANLTVTDCTGLTYIIVTDSKFPPDKNDEDWQLCNTLTGGLLSKELSTSDTYGKFWTKDAFGNISRSFSYVPITTKYDKPIQRPAAHWTFDSAHYNATTKTHMDRLGKINLGTFQYVSDSAANCDAIDSFLPYGHACSVLSTNNGVAPTNSGVLNSKIVIADNQFTRVDNNSTTKPTDKLSVASWVYIPNNYTPGATLVTTHIVGNWNGGKGYALRAVHDAANPRIEFIVKPVGQAAIAPYLETKNFITGWHLLVGTYEASTGIAKLYVDGIFTKQFTAAAPANVDYTANSKFSVATESLTGTTPPSAILHCHHGYSTNCTSGYLGKMYPYNIDEVIVWNKVLTGLEASSLYHNGADVLYPSDTTPPVKPTLALENTRPDIDTNKAYFSLSSCTDISGVLVNEGTRPDKQDDRWQVCRTRLGSFGIKNLTPGGHTVTFWFKDLAGNVTPISQDYVVNYLNNLTPRANAYWPMDASHMISNFTRDVVSTSKEHELLVTGINRDNAAAGVVAGKVHEGINLSGNSHISLYDSLAVASSSRLVRPVNYMTVGGWFYLTNADTSSKALIDNMYFDGTFYGGYQLTQSTSAIRFRVGLDLSVSGLTYVEVSTPTSNVVTGWNHVLGVWTGQEVKLYLNNTQVATSGILPEENYIRYIDNSNNSLLTYFRIGADSEKNNLPANYLNTIVDEIAVWGFDLSSSQVTQAYNHGIAGNNLENQAVAPDNVDNAFVYYYDNFGSRARFTLLDCTNTPYIYVGNYNAVAVQPDPNSKDWMDCQTTPGAILSEKLPLGSTPQYVHVWAKNAYGVMSTIPATIEIPVITEPDTLLKPISYYSFNADHYASGNPLDFLGRRSGTNSAAGMSSSAVAENGLQLAGTKYFTSQYNFNMQFIRGFTSGFWAYLTVGDASSQLLLFNPADAQALRVYLAGGYLNFNIRRTLDANYTSKSDHTTASFDVTTSDNFTVSYPTASLPYTGWYFITTTYDMQNMKLFLNGELAISDNAPRSKNQSLVDRAIYLTSTPYFRLGDDVGTTTVKVDELMMWDYPLTQKEIIAHYVRVAHQTMSSDSTPPVTAGRTIAVKESTFGGGKWSTEDSVPYITINDCSDISGIFIKVNSSTTPRYDDNGWQTCNTLNGGIQLPNLTNINGDNDVYIWLKDAAGNVNAVPLSTVITYNQNPTPTPVTYLSFDVNSMFNKMAFDYSPNHLRAEIFGAGTVNHTSATDTALSFDSVRGYARVDANSAYKPTNRLSISYWFNASSIYCNGDEHILGTVNRTLGYTVRIDGTTSTCTNIGALVFELTLSGTRKSVRVPVAQLPTGWTHVVHTFDGRKIFTYINGGAAGAGKDYFVDLNTFKTIDYGTDQDPLIIGASPNKLGRPTDLDEYFSGSIDEIAIFDKNLYPHQVLDLYNKGLAGTKVYKPARGLEDNAATLSSRFAIYQPAAAFTYGSRIKATISNCTDMDMVLVNNSTVQPSATDPDWQVCNTAAGGILSAPVGTNLGAPTSLTPKLWVKTYDGSVSTNYGTPTNAPMTMPAAMEDISRPTAYWTFDSVSRGHQAAAVAYEFLGLTKTNKPAGFTPTTASAITEDGFSFDGISTYLNATNSPNTNPMINISLAAWAYLKKGETSVRTIMSNSEGSSGAGIRTNGGKLQFFLYALEQAATTATIDSIKSYFDVGIDTNSYETGWHHITGTYDGKYLKLYLDGVLVNTYQIHFYNTSYRHLVFHDDVTPWFFGAEPGATAVSGGVNVTTPEANKYFDDKIDEPSIFDKTLSANEIYFLYLYGSQFKPGVVDNAIAATDPGILLDPNAASTASPFAYFTVPSCTGANGEKINSIYVAVNGAPAPTVTSTGWQYCNIDPRGIISPLLTVGNNTITIYLKDFDNDISTPISYNINYTPPTMPNPMAYFTMNSADKSGLYFNDKIGKKHLRTNQPADENNGYRLVSSKVAQGYQTYSSGASGVTYTSYVPISRNWSIGLSPEKDFSVSLWYYTMPLLQSGTIISKPGTFSIVRNGIDQITATIVTTSATYSKTTTIKMAPNSWNHLSLTRSGTNAKLYLNSNEVLNFVISNANLAQSANQLLLLDSEGIIDEVALFNTGLTTDQTLYNYYLAAKATPSNLEYAYQPNFAPAPIPTSYWTFDDSMIDLTSAPTRKLLDKTGSTILTIEEDRSNPPTSYLSSGQVGGNKKVGEAFYIKRYEDTINNPDADGPGNDSVENENVVGVPQYLESSSPITLYDNFSISGWFNFSKATYHDYQDREFFTLFDQWGDTPQDQSFRLYQTLPKIGAKNLNFEFRTTNSGIYTVTAGLHPNLSNSSTWHHVAIVRKGKVVSIFIDNIESGSTTLTSTEPILIPVTAKLRLANTNKVTDEGRFEGYLDEWAYWDNKALTVEQLDEIYNRGINGQELTVTPRVILAGAGDTTSIQEAPLTINDCGGYSDVYVGFVGDSPPDPNNNTGWQTCTTNSGGILTPALNSAANPNQIRVWFRTGTILSGYTYDVNINFVPSDTTPPTPPTIAMVTSTPTTSAFSTFTLSSCADGGTTINGVYVGNTGNTPTSSQDGWVACTTIAGGIKSFPLVEGTNNISFWFKDAAGNIAIGAQNFTVNYTPPALPKPNIYLPFTNNSGSPIEFDQIGNFIRESTAQIPFYIGNPNNANFKFFAVVEEGAEFLTNAYLETSTYNPTIGNELTVSAWVNIPAPGIQASIINQWDGTAANNRFAVTIDSVGRVCFDFQTTASSGSPNWSTNVYRHSCSLEKIPFASWNQVAVTRNGTSVNYYINGNHAGTDTIEGSNLKTSTLPLRVAGQQRNGGYTIDGQIDEVLFYTSALSANQLELVYARGYNEVLVYNEIQPQHAPVPLLYFDMDAANYNQPSSNLLQTNYPMNNAVYFTDLDVGSPNNFTANDPSSMGEARKFFGKNILETNTSAINIINNFSMSIWVKPSLMGGGHVLVSKWDATIAAPTANHNLNQFQVVLDEADFGMITTKFYYHTTASDTWNTAGYNILSSGTKRFNQGDGLWHNISVSRIDNYLYLYIDGQLANMTNIGPNQFVSSTRPIRLGGMNTTLTNTYIGLIEEFALWETGLQERQVMKNYLQGHNNLGVNTVIKLTAAHHTNTIKATSPTTNALLSVNDCSTYTDVLVQASTNPSPTDPMDVRWVPCTTAIGAITSPNLPNGSTTLDLWMKTSGTIDPTPKASTTITVSP